MIRIHALHVRPNRIGGSGRAEHQETMIQVFYGIREAFVVMH
jgi:hypothetical protein